MDFQVGIGGLTSRWIWGGSKNRNPSSYSSPPLKPCCSKTDPRGDGDRSSSNGGGKFSTDWDKAWSSFKKRGKKTLFSQFSLDKYVSWNPKPSDYPLSEEVDPIKRAERSNLMLWTSPTFTLVGAIVIVSLLLIYTILSPIK